MPIRARNLARPPANWGMCKIIPLRPLGQADANTEDELFVDGVRIPYDFDLFGYSYAVGSITGGTAPSVDLLIDITRGSLTGATWTSPDFTHNGLAAIAQAFVDLSANPTRRIYSAALPWVAARANLNMGGTQVTHIGAIHVDLFIIPVE